MKVKTSKRCRVKGCQHPAYYQGYCSQHLNPLLGGQPDKPLRYWPPADREQATTGPEETRGNKP